MFQVKIYGAGSIGNHLAHASRSLGWGVHLCDINDAALERTRLQIYPGRYGKWDGAIQLFNAKKVPRDIYDLIIVGTSPESHVKLALDALSEKPKAILVEKPFCTPDLAQAEEFYLAASNSKVKVFIGYDHVVGMAARKTEDLLVNGNMGEPQAMDVEFREHWAGIFSAHPWLSGPADTYLGFWKKGGGASGEHSHAINLWQHFAHSLGAGRVTEVSAALDYVKDKNVDYDRACFLNLKTETGFTGRVAQDVVTLPARKWARVQLNKGYAELFIGAQPGTDMVSWQEGGQGRNEVVIKKTRPDDFILELKHIQDSINSESISPLRLERALDTMLVVAAAHRSAREKRAIEIDYTKGYSARSLK
jgi:predicted dehydrogenase